MRRDLPDYHEIREEHVRIHGRLVNWGRYVKPKWGGAATHPMWLNVVSSEVWGAPPPKIPIDTLDGQHIEEAIRALDEKPREALRWHYCFWHVSPHKVCRYLSITAHDLAGLIHEGRAMLNCRA